MRVGGGRWRRVTVIRLTFEPANVSCPLHNLRAFRDPRANPVAEAFDAWLRDAMSQPAAERDRRLEQWETAPSARAAHPPLMFPIPTVSCRSFRCSNRRPSRRSGGEPG